MFRLGTFTSHSGMLLPWKIDCDTLTIEDWKCLAWKVSGLVTPFGIVEAVPRGGCHPANWLEPYKTKDSLSLLIVDDVLSTGQSMEAQRAGRKAMGVVIFARGLCPKWITPLFQMHH